MEIFEITGLATGVNRSGVNYLQPADSFQNIINGFIYRQVLQSRQGIGFFAPRLSDNTRVFGIFEHTLTDSTKELLVFDKNFLYKFNTGTGVFDQIPFGGSLATYEGFNISANDFYISGTSYPAAQFKSDGSNNPAYGSNGSRFIFTGLGIRDRLPSMAPIDSTIFQYDGTQVTCFTNISDNPNYQNPTTIGTLTRASYVVWFGERLNFLVPVISGKQYYQGMLYSGIRNNSGNGDKFNVAGSALLQADTYQTITGITILGQVMALNMDRSNWTIEKTQDAFNPYFIRQVPSVIGTNANFSAVTWFDTVKSIGRTGIIETDGRQTTRVDNKIPYFTMDEIEPSLFNLTYGGFDRLNNQFLWSYKDAGGDPDDENQDRVLVGNYEFNTWSIFDQRFSVFGQTNLGINKTWNQIDDSDRNDKWAKWNTTEDIWNRIGIGNAVQKTLAGDELGFIYELNKDYDDYSSAITNITQASSAVLTINASGFKKGDLVSIQDVEGMTEINNYDPSIQIGDSGYFESIINFNPWIVTAATATSVTINCDSSNYTPYTQGGLLTKIISFEAETIPFNPYRSQGKRVYVSEVEFLIDTNGGYLEVEFYADEETTPFKGEVFLIPNTILKDREWITATVDQEANFITIKMKQQSPASQLRLTSMRIHAEMGGDTSG